jgi:hypothetical protein
VKGWNSQNLKIIMKNVKKREERGIGRNRK